MLKKILHVTLAVLTVFATLGPAPLLSAVAQAATPDTLSYQGRLRDSDGTAVANDSYEFVFTLYDALSDGSSLWTETQTLTVTDGYFSAQLGADTALTGDIVGGSVWLEVQVEGETLDPRVAINAVAYAITSRGVESLAAAPDSGLYAGRMYFDTGEGQLYVLTAVVPPTWTAVGQDASPTFTGLVTANGGITADGGVFTVADATGAVHTGSTLDVDGASNFDGAVVANSTLAVTGATTLTGLFTANGGITADGGVFTVADTTGALHTGSTIDVDGASNFDGAVVANSTLAVTGATTLTGAATLSSTLAVTGATTLTGLFTANGGITADGGVFTVADITGAVHTNSSLDVDGSSNFDGAVVVGGASTFNGATSFVSSTTFSGAVSFDGSPTFSGQIKANGGIGNASGQLTIDPTTYTSIGSGSSPGVATGAGDLFVKSDLEVDALSDFAGAVTMGSSLSIAGATTLTGLFTANGGITADGGVFTVADTTGAIHTGSTLDVDGASNFDGAVVANGGITSTAGEVLVSGGNVHLNDGVVLSFGTGNDLVIEHDGANSSVSNQTGDLTIEATGLGAYVLIPSDVSLGNAGTSMDISSDTLDVNAVTDFINNVVFDTDVDFLGANTTFNSGFFAVGGEALFSAGNVQLNDGIVLTLGTGDDLSLSHDGANTAMTNGAAGGSLSVNASGGVINIGNSSNNYGINVGTGGIRPIAIGNADASTTLSLTGGNDWSVDATGNATLLTAVIGGGYGSTGATIGSDGSGSFDALISGAGGLDVGGGIIYLNNNSAFATNIGTGASSGSVTIGGTAGSVIDIGTNNAIADTIGIGSALDALTIASSGLNVATTGAITGALSVAVGGGFGSTGTTLGSDGAISTDGLVTANGGITADGGVFTVADATGAIHTGSTLDVDGTSEFTGEVKMNGGLSNATLDWQIANSGDASFENVYFGGGYAGGGAEISSLGVSSFSGALTANGLITGSSGASITGAFSASSVTDAANTIALNANGGTTESIRIRSQQGTGSTSINLVSTAGGITLNALGATAITNAASVGGTLGVTGNTNMNGNVTIGDTVGDILSVAPTALGFIKENAHIIQVNDSTTATAAGGALTVKAGAGNTTGDGGAMTILGGTSGAGATGNGGALSITAGSAGSTNGNGGSVTIDAGARTGAGVKGDITIGGTNAQNINIGGGLGVVTITQGTINVGTTVPSTITIGSTNNTNTLTFGQSTDSNTINIGNGATANTKTQTINIGAGTGTGTGMSAVTIGETNGASSLTLNSGTGSILVGNTAQARTISIGGGAAAQTVSLGSTNSTSSTTINSGTGNIDIGVGPQARAINLGTGGAVQTVTIGSNDTTSVTAIRAGSAGVTVDLLAATTSVAVCSDAAGGGGAKENALLKTCTVAPTADYAERYPVAAGITYGDIVVPGSDSVVTTDGDEISQMVKSSVPYQGPVSGIVSNNYGNFTSAGNNISDADNPMPVALVGRVPVNVTNENGPIAVGDFVTTSSSAGKGMRATEAGRVVGMALASFDGTDGQVMVQVVNTWYQPDASGASSLQGGSSDGLSLAAGDLTVSGNATFSGSVTVAEHLVGSSDMAGRARIVAGDTRVHVAFERSYSEQPIVNATLRTNVNIPGYWWVEEESTTGFDLLLDGTLTSDVEFNWIAVGVSDGKVSVSDGSSRDIVVYVLDAGTSAEPTPTEDISSVEAPTDGVPATEDPAVDEPASPSDVVPQTETVVSEEALVSEPSAEEPPAEPAVAEEPSAEENPAEVVTL